MLIGAIKLTKVGSFYDCKSATFDCFKCCMEIDPNVLCVGDVRLIIIIIIIIIMSSSSSSSSSLLSSKSSCV